MPHCDPLRKMFTVTGLQNVHFSNTHPNPRISLCQKYAATFRQADIILQPSFSYRKHKFARIKLYLLEHSSATQMRTKQDFQVTFSSCCGTSPTVHQEFKETSQAEDAFLHLLEQTCGQPPQIQASWQKYICMSNRETHSLAQNVVPSLQLASQPGKAAAPAGAHQSDPGFAAGATSLENNSYTGTLRFQDQPILPTKARSKWDSREMWP